MRTGLWQKLRKDSPEVRLVLAVMEAEAWFIAEHTHFQRLDPALTRQFIRTECGFDPAVVDVESLPQPSNDLRRIYGLVGRPYEKTRGQVEAIVAALSFPNLYTQVRPRVPALAGLLDSIDEFLR